MFDDLKKWWHGDDINTSGRGPISQVGKVIWIWGRRAMMVLTSLSFIVLIISIVVIIFGGCK